MLFLIKYREFTYTATGVDGNTSHVQYFEVPLDAGKELVSVTLPNGEVGGSRLHIFSMSLFTSSALLSSGPGNASVAPGPSLTFQYIRSRNQWFNDSARPSAVEDLAMTYVKTLGTSKSEVLDTQSNGSPDIIQVIEVAISNLPPVSTQTDPAAWLTGENTVMIQSDQVRTVYAGILNRLRPGDQARVKVGVVNTAGVARGTSASARAVVSDSRGNVIAQSGEFQIVAGIPAYEPTIESLQVHEAPKWYEDAKVIFMCYSPVYSEFTNIVVWVRSLHWFSSLLLLRSFEEYSCTGAYIV